MTKEELLEKLNEIQAGKYESQVVEIKAAEQGCPKRLYDTLSSFSNQDDGGTIVFGVDEKDNYSECGVYDPQDIQKKINEQCLQMEPAVRPLLTVVEKEGKHFVSAEVPGIDLADRPCYYQGRGRLKGSYIRVGDSDEPMTEYEVYSYEAFRKKYQDDIREVPRAYFPQLCITAVVLPGDEIGEYGERFVDNKRIEGNIPEMLDQALAFVRKNMRTRTIINPNTGKTQKPETKICEEVSLNAKIVNSWSSGRGYCDCTFIDDEQMQIDLTPVF